MLEKQLEKRKNAIVKEWFEEILKTYHSETSQFMKNKKDPFANPVGQTTLKGLEALFDELLGGMDRETVVSFLDPIIRIRNIQDFTPSTAVGFIYSLKNIIRDMFENEISDGQVFKELLDFESKIDELGLIAFDIYMACKETIYKIKATETRNRTFRAFERAGLVRDDDEADTVLK